MGPPAVHRKESEQRHGNRCKRKVRAACLRRRPEVLHGSDLRRSANHRPRRIDWDVTGRLDHLNYTDPDKLIPDTAKGQP
ncbi:hypothetical protein [Nocardioides sp. NPDC006273]|uniref:hypothetical protein n=1 Tax=Nocardioides sp. NPDC006273 TaxID=3155598 RepID=UPI0033A8AF45